MNPSISKRLITATGVAAAVVAAVLTLAACGGSEDSARIQVGEPNYGDASRQAGGRLEDPSKKTAALEAELDKVNQQLKEQEKLKKDALAVIKAPSKTRTHQQTVDAVNTFRAADKKIDELEKTRQSLETQLRELPRTVR